VQSVRLSVRLSVPWRSFLGYRLAGCLQLSHRRPPEICGLRTRPRTDVDPSRFLPPSNCHRRGGAYRLGDPEAIPCWENNAATQRLSQIPGSATEGWKCVVFISVIHRRYIGVDAASINLPRCRTAVISCRYPPLCSFSRHLETTSGRHWSSSCKKWSCLHHWAIITASFNGSR